MTSVDALPSQAHHAPSDTSPRAVHATAVAIEGRALLIRGPSKIGKSRLALALIAASTRRRPIGLIGDDRIILTRSGGDLIARPHPRIAGFIERRGLGIVAMPFHGAAPLAGVLDLVPAQAPRLAPDVIVMAGINFPLLSIVVSGIEEYGAELRSVRSLRVLDWFAGRDKRTTHTRESMR